MNVLSITSPAWGHRALALLSCSMLNATKTVYDTENVTDKNEEGNA
jgi:hypothetical protein